jgi:hypothetical protein
MTGSYDVRSRRHEMAIVKVALFFFVGIMVALILAGLLLTHLRFFIYIGVVGLIVYGIYALVTSRRST